jgi:5-methylthioadenosine/S-adenosylhomocysteine deaminase
MRSAPKNALKKPGPETMDKQYTLVSARWVVPMEGPTAVLADHSVVLEGERIAAVLPTPQARAQYGAQAAEVALAEHVLIPGLINMHAHSAMTLLRGVADDRDLMDWLQNAIWPIERAFMGPEFVHDGSLLAAAESLRGGITYTNDMYFYPVDGARAAIAAGMRFGAAINVLEFPTPYAANAQEYISRGLEVHARFKDHPLIDITVAPHAPYTVSDASFLQMAQLCSDLGVRMHCHVHETQVEVDDGLKQHGMRPLARLDRLGLLNERFQAVHMVALDPADLALCAARGLHLIHNPSSNMKLGSGASPVQALHDLGVNVALGTDGAASNNRLDLFTEMRAAALLAKVSGLAPRAVPARVALEMATICGARALGRDHELGSLKPGKLADLVAVDLGSPECQPVFDPISQLVYAAGREHVSDVWVGGRRVLKSRELTTLDLREVGAKARAWGEKIRNRAAA